MRNAEPLICAIMLTYGRETAGRAVRAFAAQTYENKRLLLLDSRGEHGLLIPHPDGLEGVSFRWKAARGEPGLTIGVLRNLANLQAEADIIFHWDDDDYSHPNRIAEQVALLQSTGADLVGYREMLFWRDMTKPALGIAGVVERDYNPQAWLYRHNRATHALGTSFCYWRKTWERKPFQDLPRGPGGTGEDWTFLQGLNVVSESAMKPDGPRMIASIHGGNSSQAYAPERNPNEWKRAPKWDEHCRKVMTL